MSNQLVKTEVCSAHELLKQRTRFGLRELLTAMLLCSLACAAQPAVGWKATLCMTCSALALVMGWGYIALVGLIAALIVACYEPDPVMAALVCFAVLMMIAVGPLTVHKLGNLWSNHNIVIHLPKPD